MNIHEEVLLCIFWLKKKAETNYINVTLAQFSARMTHRLVSNFFAPNIQTLNIVHFLQVWET